MSGKVIYLPPPKKKSGGGLDGGGQPPYSGDHGGNDMEARLVKLETLADITKTTLSDIKGDVREIRQDMKEIRKDMQTDFRILFSSLIFVALGLAGVMAKGFGWLK